MFPTFVAFAGASVSLISSKQLLRYPQQDNQSAWRVAFSLISALGAFVAGIAVRDCLQSLSISPPIPRLESGDTHNTQVSWIQRICGVACRPFGFFAYYANGGLKKRLYAKEGLGSDGPGIGPNILIAVTGSVASVKIPELVLHFRRLSPCCRIRIISTVAGKRMLSKCKGYDSEAWGKFCALNLEVLDDSDEW